MWGGRAVCLACLTSPACLTTGDGHTSQGHREDSTRSHYRVKGWRSNMHAPPPPLSQSAQVVCEIKMPLKAMAPASTAPRPACRMPSRIRRLSQTFGGQQRPARLPHRVPLVRARATAPTTAAVWEEKHGKPLPFGVCATQGLREEMEDMAAVVPKAQGGFLYAGVFDGHAGVDVAEYLAQNLYGKLEQSLGRMSPSDIGASSSKVAASLPGVFQKMDDEVLEWLRKRTAKGQPVDETGSTATCLLASPEKIIVANVGDSRAVLGRAGKAIDLSTEHRAYGKGKVVKAETERIESVGGWVKNGRVCDMLAVTRAFGDAEFKGQANLQALLEEGIREGYWTEDFAAKVKFTGDPVVATPDVTEMDVTPADEFLIMASDGLWDVFTSAQAVALLRKEYLRNKSAQALADILVDRANERKTKDNVVVVVVVLKDADDVQKKTVRSKKSKSGMFGMF